MESRASSYIIVREDLEVDPLTLVTDGLKIGRLPECELTLNHPTVSRLHAGIREADGDFYVYNFSHSSGTTLNGRIIPLETAEFLAVGDVLQIGPFSVRFERVSEGLLLRVSLHVTAQVGEELEADESERTKAKTSDVSVEVSNALGLFWAARRREAGKVQRLSPLRPHKPSRVLGKARFNWTPTRDLVQAWPVSIFVWGAIIIGTLTLIAAYKYASAFAPNAVSNPHTRSSFNLNPAIAQKPNAGSCTACHTVRLSMNEACSKCHDTHAFKSSTIKEHERAGIGCINCHTEHRGEEFSPSVGALQSCAQCHNDENEETYEGKRVGTPHGGTFGYPVEDGVWIWEGIDEREWARKPENIQRSVGQWPVRDENSRRSALFHALHLHRVSALPGQVSNQDGELSCSTCHTSFFPTVDRETPRTTCAACHNGEVANRFGGKVFPANAPNCTSCHVQHPEGRRIWGATLLEAADSAGN